MYKQLIIARKDLEMGAGKLSGQVSHGSMAFLTNIIRESSYPVDTDNGPSYYANFTIGKDLYEDWICGIFTKVVCGAKNLNHLLKAKKWAEDHGLTEGKDFGLIADCCRTDLEPEFIDENGIGRTYTCLWFKPFPSEFIDEIGKKYQLYR